MCLNVFKNARAQLKRHDSKAAKNCVFEMSAIPTARYLNVSLEHLFCMCCFV